MATEIWVNIGSGNGLLPDGTKPLPEPMLTDHQWSPVTFIIIMAISQEMPQPSTTKIHLKITHLKYHSNFPGANELMKMHSERGKQVPSNLKYKLHLSKQWTCWSLRCYWNVACQRCSNYIFILDLTPVASFTKEVNPRLAKCPLKTNGRLANLGLTSLVKEATGFNGLGKDNCKTSDETRNI